MALPWDLVPRLSRRGRSIPCVKRMILMFGRTCIKYSIQLTFGGTISFRVPPLVKAHSHLTELVPKLPLRFLFEHLQEIPEFDVRKKSVRLEVPPDGGLEVGQ